MLLHIFAVGVSMELSGAVSFGQLISFLTSSNPSSRPTCNVSVSKYSGSVSSQNFFHASFLIRIFTLSYGFWYFFFQVHMDFTDISLHSGWQISDVAGEYLLRYLFLKKTVILFQIYMGACL